MADSVEQDETAHYEPSHLDLHFWLVWSPVSAIKVISSLSVYLTTLFLGRLSPLSG